MPQISILITTALNYRFHQLCCRPERSSRRRRPTTDGCAPSARTWTRSGSAETASSFISSRAVREKSDMQIAEERMKVWSVPRTGVYAHPITHRRGGGDTATATKYLSNAVETAREQWQQGSVGVFRARRSGPGAARKRQARDPRPATVHLAEWRRPRGRLRGWSEARDRDL